MVSLGSLFHKQGKGVPPIDANKNSSAHELKASKSKKLQRPSVQWTPRQIFYVFIMQGIGAFIIAGGINLAIAYGMPSLRLPP